MITGYAIFLKNRFYVVPANTKRFTKAIADKFISQPIFQDLLKAHPDKLNPDILYRDMVDNKRYIKINFEYRPQTDTGNGIEPRYYINTKSMIGYWKPEQFIVIE